MRGDIYPDGYAGYVGEYVELILYKLLVEMDIYIREQEKDRLTH
ncbi:hypothetical protein IC575_013987 [Cucumis melo]